MAKLTTLARARLRWRARRGMLENDLILTRFWIIMRLSFPMMMCWL